MSNDDLKLHVLEISIKLQLKLDKYTGCESNIVITIYYIF